jgi:hypothetical protein
MEQQAVPVPTLEPGYPFFSSVLLGSLVDFGSNRRAINLASGVQSRRESSRKKSGRPAAPVLLFPQRLNRIDHRCPPRRKITGAERNNDQRQTHTRECQRIERWNVEQHAGNIAR